MKFKTVRLFIGISLVVASQTFAHAGVYDDARMWIRDPKDANANGVLDPGEIRDMLHLGVPGYDDSFTIGGRYPASVTTNYVSIAEVPVVYPSAFATNTPAVVRRCLRFNATYDASTTDGKLFYSTPTWDGSSLCPITNAVGFSAVVRFRQFKAVGDVAEKRSTVIGQVGFNYNKFAGMMVMTRMEGGVVCAAIYTGKVLTKFTNVILPLGYWHDVAYCYDPTTGKATVYAVSRIGNSIVEQKESLGVGFGGDQSAYSRSIVLGGENSLNAFDGELENFAYWTRMLSEKEVYESFRFPFTHDRIIGVNNGSNGEFAGSSGGEAVEDELDTWRKLPATLSPGEYFTYSYSDFSASGTQYEQQFKPLSRVLVLRGNSGSETAHFDVFANGVKLGRMEVRNHYGDFFLNGRSGALRYGTNAIKIVRADSEGTAFALDDMAMLGAWYANPIDGVKPPYEPAPKTELATLLHNVKVNRRFLDEAVTAALSGRSDDRRTLKFEFEFPVEAATHYGAMLCFRMRGASDTIGKLNVADNITAKMDGVAVSLVSGGKFGEPTRVGVVKYGAGELSAGKHTFTMSIPKTSTADWYQIDGVRFEPQSNPGLMLLFR